MTIDNKWLNCFHAKKHNLNVYKVGYAIKVTAKRPNSLNKLVLSILFSSWVITQPNETFLDFLVHAWLVFEICWTKKDNSVIYQFEHPSSADGGHSLQNHDQNPFVSINGKISCFLVLTKKVRTKGPANLNNSYQKTLHF